MLGVWHSAQPVLANVSRPRLIESAPPGLSAEGVGGARKRMNSVKRSIELSTAAGVAPSRVASLLGTVATLQASVSSRSVGKAPLVMPISTLYASPEKISSDLFCAFQPKRPVVPSLPFLFGWPE